MFIPNSAIKSAPVDHWILFHKLTFNLLMLNLKQGGKEKLSFLKGTSHWDSYMGISYPMCMGSRGSVVQGSSGSYVHGEYEKSHGKQNFLCREIKESCGN